MGVEREWTPGSSTVDWDAARRLVPGGAAGLRHLARGMRAETVRHLATIRDGLAGGDTERVRIAAHTLKSGSGYFGARDVMSAAEKVEAAAGARDLDGARRALPALQALCTRFLRDLEHAESLAADPGP